MAQPTFDPTQPFVEEKSVPQAPVFDPSQPFVDEDISQPQVAIQRPRSVRPIQVPTPDEVFGRQPEATAPSSEEDAGIGEELGGTVRAIERGGRRFIQAGSVAGLRRPQELQDSIASATADLAKFDSQFGSNPRDPVGKRWRMDQLGKIVGLQGELKRWEKIRPELAKSLAAQQQAIEKLPVTKAQAEFQKESTPWWHFFYNPVELSVTTLAESLPVMAQSMVAAPSGPVGVAAMTGAGSFTAESSGRVLNAMSQAGVDLKNPEAVMTWFKDRAHSNPELAKADLAAIGPAAFDALTAGIAGKFLGPAVGKGVRPVLTATGKEMGIQMAGGGLGSIAGQKLAGEPIDWKDFVLEVAGEFAPGEAVSNVLAERRANANRKQSPMAPPGVTRPGSVPQAGEGTAGAVQQIAEPGQAQAEGPAPVAPLGPDMDTARRIIQMTPAEFLSQAKSFNKWNIAIGQNATPAEYEELKQLRDQAVARFQQAQAAVKANRNDQTLQDFATLGMMPQFYNEAIAEYERKNLPPAPGAGAGPTQPAEAGTPGQVVKPEGGDNRGLQEKEKGQDAILNLPDGSVADDTATDTIQPDVITQEVPIAKAVYSHAAVPNFKGNVDLETGTVPGQELSGKYERVGTAPVVLWEPLNPEKYGLNPGEYAIATGRHRAQLAKASGEPSIPAQVLRESEGWTREKVMMLDAASNIRDGQGTIEDYADFFRSEFSKNLTEAEARQQGLLARSKGRAGWDIGKSASEDLFAIWKAGRISDAQAAAIARTAPGNADVQRIGIRGALKGDVPQKLVQTVQAALAYQTTATQDDWFSNTALEEEWRKEGYKVLSAQREIEAEIKAVKNAASNPAAAAKHGVDVKDPEGVRKKITALQAELDRWDKWREHPDLVAQIKGQPVVMPPVAPVPKPKAVEPAKGLTIDTSKRYTLPKTKSPAAYTITKVIEPSAIERENGEQPVEIKSENTGEVQTVDFADLKEVAPKVEGGEKPEKRDLNAELDALNVPADSYKGLTNAEKREMIRRVKARNKPSVQKREAKKQQPKSPEKKPEPPKPKTKEEIDAELKARVDKIHAALRKKFGGLGSGPILDPEIITLGAELVSIHAQQGVRKFSEFAQRVKAELPDIWDAIKSHLRSMWEAASVNQTDLEEVTRAQADETIKGLDGTKAVKTETKEAKDEPRSNVGAPERVGAGGAQGQGGQVAITRIITARPELTEEVAIERIPEDLRKNLNDVQQQNAEKAIRSLDEAGGFLDASGTGVGKTRIALTVAENYRRQGKKVIIITKAETLTRDRDFKTGRFRGSYWDDSQAMGVPVTMKKEPKPKAGEIQLTTYENLASVPADKETVLLFDEAHALKNPDSNRSASGVSAIANADKVLFLSATPADKPLHIHYLAKMGAMEGKTLPDQYRALGLQRLEIQKKDKSGRRYTQVIWRVNSNIGEEEVLRRFKALFDRMTQQGRMVKREISMDGVEVNIDRIALPESTHQKMQEIEDFYGGLKEKGGLNNARILMHQRRQQEPDKIPRVIEHTLRELSEGRKVIIFLHRVNESAVTKKVKIGELYGGEAEYETVELMSSEGTAKTLKAELLKAGLKPEEIAELHGGAEGDVQESVNNFNKGPAKVIIATIESGGTGINLDDRKGDEPRTMILMTPPFDAVGNVQAAGRQWRLPTKSYPRMIYILSDTDVDEWNASIIGSKMKQLGATVKGEVGRLDIADPDLVTEADFVREKVGAEKPANVQPGDFPALQWKEFKTKNGRIRFVAPATQPFWDWWEANGQKENPLKVSISKFKGQWQVWADTPIAPTPVPEAPAAPVAEVPEEEDDAWKNAVVPVHSPVNIEENEAYQLLWGQAVKSLGLPPKARWTMFKHSEQIAIDKKIEELAKASPNINISRRISRKDGVTYLDNIPLIGWYRRVKRENELDALQNPPKPATPVPEREARWDSIVKLAADSVPKLRVSDVDRVMSEVPAEERKDFIHWFIGRGGVSNMDTLEAIQNWTPEKPAEPVAPVAEATILPAKGAHLPPNSAFVKVVNYDGITQGYVAVPYDGTPEGAIASLAKAQKHAHDNFAWKTEYYNIESQNGATDENGKLKWVISPNRAHLAEPTTDQARYILGDLSARPKPAALLAEPEKPSPTKLTPAQQKRLHLLVQKYREIEKGGEELTPAELKELEDLRAIGQEELLKEPTGANEAAARGEIARLRRKAEELDRQAVLVWNRELNSRVSEVKDKLRKDAQKIEQEAINVRNQADELEQALNPQAKPDLTLTGEQATEQAPTPPPKSPDQGDLFSAPNSPEVEAEISRQTALAERGQESKLSVRKDEETGDWNTYEDIYEIGRNEKIDSNFLASFPTEEAALAELARIRKIEKSAGFMMEVARNRNQRETAINSNLAAAGDRGAVRLVAVDKKYGATMLIVAPSPSPEEAGKWRLTSFDDSGPIGHHLFDSRDAALRAASGESHTKKVSGPSYYSAGDFKVDKVADDMASLVGWQSSGPAEPQADTTYHDLLTNWQTADTVLEALGQDQNLPPFERDLLDRFKALGLQTRVKLMPQSEATRRGLGSANGVYNTRGDFIYLFPASPNNTRTLIHEFTHAATVNAMTSDPEFAAELESILAAAKEQIRNTGLYGLNNTNELVAEAFSSPEFQKALQGVKVGNETLWDRFVNWVRRVLGLPVTQKNALEQVISLSTARLAPNTVSTSGDLASMPNEPARDQMGDNLADIEASGELEKALDDAQKDGLFDKTQRMGVQDAILGRQHLTPEVRAAGEAYSEAIFRQAGLPVEPDEDGWFQLSDPSTPQEAQGHKLLELVRGELAKYADDKSGYLGHLINSIRNNMAPGSGIKAFSEPLLLDLYAATQGEASHRGLLLGALAGLQKSIAYVGRNVKAMLHKEYHTRFGGDFVDKVLPRIITEFRGFFTNAEIDDAVKNNPKLKEFFDKVFALNRADAGGRLYRRVQSYLKPRGKKAKAMVENAKLEEAFNEIIAQAEKLGITKPPVEGKKALTPREALAVMAKPETTDQLNQAIEIAVGDAEKAAARKVALKEAKDEEARAEIMSEEWEPTEDQVEAGLDLPEFSHWREIRDNLLGYSPITLKLAQKLIQSEFKGTDFGTKKTSTDALKIDLNKMAIAPEEEVRRVLEAYYQGVEATITRAGASQETRDRVLTLVRDEVAAQLDKAKARRREPLFRDLPKPGEGKTPETRLEELTNAGLFMDPRLDSKEQVEKVAAKSPFTKLVPNLPDLIKAALETPFYRQGDLGRAFADQLVKQFGVDPESVKGASTVFNQAFQTKFAKAKEMALKRVEASLTPQERREATVKKPTWKKISEAVNSGYFDSGESLRRIAKENGWMEPTDEVLKKMRDWVDKMERMKELTQSELDAVGDNPVDLERAQREKASVTLEKRVAIKKQIEAMWARLTHPLGFNKALSRENMVRAVAEFASANLLFKLSFPVRQIVDVMTQGGIHTPTRAIAAAIERYQVGGDNVSFWNEAQSALRDAYRARSRSYTAALQAARDAFAGTGEARNVDRLMSRIAVFDRADQIADELQAAGKPGQAALLRLFTILRMGFRLAQAMDNLHGLPAEYQEMRQQVVTTLRENGMSSAEAFNEADKVIGDIKAEYQLAVARAQAILDGLHSAGLLSKAPTTNDVRGAAWQLVKWRQYQRMKELGMPADDFEESNRLLRSTVGWNEREEGGIGGAIGTILSTAGRVAAKSPYFTGLPFVSLTRFGNAIATSINRTLSFTPLGFFPGAFEGSPWYKSDTDKTQRKVEAAIGTTLGLTVLALAVAGLLRVRNRWPKDKEERELWEREGHRPGTVEMDLGNGSFIPVSMTTGPLTLLRPWLTAGGAIRDLLDDRAKAQERLNVEAAKRGLKPGTIDPVSATDLMAVAGWTGWGSVIGGRTASGLIGSLTDYGTPNLKKGTASVVSPLLPTVPMAQELSRMAGVRVDPKLAGVLDFLLPVPGSKAQQLNLLGDKVGTEDDIQRVIQILTGGTGLPVTPDDERSAQAYSTLYASGYRPPSINPSKGYDFGGEYRPMTGNELAKYASLRGEYLKQELAGIAGETNPSVVRKAYTAANNRALTDMGITVSRTTVSTPTATLKRTTVTPAGPRYRIPAGRALRRMPVRRAAFRRRSPAMARRARLRSTLMPRRKTVRARALRVG